MYTFTQTDDTYICIYIYVYRRAFLCTINSKINDTPKGVYLPILELLSILAVANLLAHNNITISYFGQVNYHMTCGKYYTIHTIHSIVLRLFAITSGHVIMGK